jgi:hypothetical protein
MRRTILAVAVVAGSALAIYGVVVLRARPTEFGRHSSLDSPGSPGSRGQPIRISPHESVTATVDGARLTIVYGRPSMRGRVVFGSLVPYGRVWCPGADEATTLESSRVLQIANLRIPTGPHTIWMLPQRDRWTLIISREPEGFHTRYNTRADLGRVPLTRRDLEAPIEQLTFAVVASPSGGGTIAMSWEKTEVSASFSVVE